MILLGFLRGWVTSVIVCVNGVAEFSNCEFNGGNMCDVLESYCPGGMETSADEPEPRRRSEPPEM